MRRHNLSTILRLVHRSGPTSRSSLARLTSLNKSTVGALAKELLDLGLVEELIPNSNSHVGRPSRVVAASEKVVAIAVSPEIGAVTVGIVALGGKVLRRVRYPTLPSRSVAQAVSLSAAFIDGMRSELDRDFQVVGVGVAVPGMVHSPDGIIRIAPHHGWANEPLVDMLHEATGYPVFADNDARLGSLAARNFGVGKGIDDIIFLNGSAGGITGGIITGGNAVSGFSGYGGAFCHVKVGDSSKTDSAGIKGTLEAEVTRAALLEALGLPDADPDELERALLASTSPAVRLVVEQQLDHLALALGSAINILNPGLIVLGGFLATLFRVDPLRLENAIAAMTLGASYTGMEIRVSELGFDMLLIGAAELVFDALLQDPAGIKDNRSRMDDQR